MRGTFAFAVTFAMPWLPVSACDTTVDVSDAGSSEHDASIEAGAPGVEGGAPSVDAAAVADAYPDPDEAHPRFLDYIRAAPYAALAFEVDSVPGFEPRSGTQSSIVERFDELLSKPEGIRFIAGDALTSRGSDHNWTFDELNALANDTFDTEAEGNEVRMHVMFLDGRYEPEGTTGTVLGLAWGHKHIAMFKQSIERGCGSTSLVPALKEEACRAAEISVLTHEIGHIIGLVDNGLTMVNDHRDPDHGKHDHSDECVMYWAYEGEAVFDVIVDRLTSGDDAQISFDAACLADIEAARNSG